MGQEAGRKGDGGPGGRWSSNKIILKRIWRPYAVERRDKVLMTMWTGEEVIKKFLHW